MKIDRVVPRCSFLPWCRWSLPLIMGAMILTLPASSSASPQSLELLRQGATELSEGHYDAALQQFQTAAQTDATDAEAPFFQGVALNRLGRHQQALEQLVKAAGMGNSHPDQAFETGWALVGLSRWDEAITQLEAHEGAHPGRGQTQEFLGRAYLGLGQLDKAEAAFNEALRRDPNLESTIRFHQVDLARQRGNAPAPLEGLQSLLEESPDTPLGNLLRRRLGSAAGMPAAPEKPWSVSVSLGAGYNSNALFLGDGVPLPADTDDKSDTFLAATLDARYTWQLGRGDSLTAGYSFLGNFHRELSDVNDANHLLFAAYRHPFSNGKLVGSLRLSDNYTEIGGDRFRNSIGVRPALTFVHSERSSTELAYDFASNRYYFDTTAVQDRDGHSHSFTLTHFIRPRNTRLELALGAFYLLNSARGDDFDYDSPGVFVSLRYPLPWKMNGEISYSHSWDRYDNPNSQSTPSFSEKRRDDVDAVFIQLTRPLRERSHHRIDMYLRSTYRNNDSNIPFQKHHQFTVSAGIIASF